MARLSYSYPAPVGTVFSAATRSLLFGSFTSVKRNDELRQVTGLAGNFGKVVIDTISVPEGTAVTVFVRPSFGVDFLWRSKRTCRRIHNAIGAYLKEYGEPAICPPVHQVPAAYLPTRSDK